MIKADQSLRDYIYQKIHHNINILHSLPQIQYEDIEIPTPEEKFKTRVSQLTSCLRKEFFRYKKAPTFYDPKSYLSLQAGTFLHQLIQYTLKDDLISKEEKIEYQDLFTGHYDGIINFQNENSLIEIKSASPFALQKVLQEIAMVEKDYQSLNPNMTLYRYLIQANAYIYALKDITSGWLILVNKASVKNIDTIFTMKFQYDENLAGVIINNAEKLADYIKNNTLPPPIESSWECSYCPYIKCDMNKTKIENYEM